MDTPHNPPRILVVDDEDGVRQMLVFVLARKGFEVAQASNGNEAMRLYKEREFDVVVTDLIMPDKEGIETILEMRALKRPVRIIAISGGGRMDHTMHLNLARSVGADRVLSKPFMPDELVAIINELLGKTGDA